MTLASAPSSASARTYRVARKDSAAAVTALFLMPNRATRADVRIAIAPRRIDAARYRR